MRIGKTEYQVVGVARDIKYSSLAERPQPHMYLALEQNFTSAVVLHVRSAGAPGAVLASLRELIRGLDANLPIYDARTLDEHLGTAVFAQRMGANLLGVMGVLALVLAAVGLYGVIAYAVSQRTQEMGIRLALGAAPRDLLAMIVGQGMKLTVAGVAIGLVAGVRRWRGSCDRCCLASRRAIRSPSSACRCCSWSLPWSRRSFRRDVPVESIR